MKKILLFMLFIFIFGCKGGFPEIPSEGKIEGYIRDIITNEPVENVLIQVSDIKYSTNREGYFSLYRDTKNEEEMFLIPYENGNSYSIKKDGYYEKKGIVMLKYGQKNLLGYITPKPSEKKYIISGKVYSKQKGALENANVIVNTTFGMQSRYIVTTDINGSFTIIDIPAGKVNLYIYKDGYEPFSKVIDLNSDWTDDKIIINENTSIRYGEIQGNIRDSKGSACDYSKVSIGQENSIYYQYVITDSSGNYIIKGVPAGKNQITIKSPGFYKENLIEINVTAGAISYGNVKMEYIDYQD